MACPVASASLVVPSTRVPSTGISGLPNKADKFRIGYLTPSLLGGPQVGGIAKSPLHSRGSPTKGTKSELVASPLPSRGPTSGRNFYVTPTFSGVPESGDKIKSGYLTTALSGAHKWVELLRNPAFSRVPSKGDKSKSGCIGGKDENFICAAQKNITKKKFAEMVCLHQKNTLKKTPQTIFKKGGV